MTSATHYQDLPGLGVFFLEDSYVLAIHVSGDELAFDLDVILLNDHPDYAAPAPGEQYCYRLGRLPFGRPSDLRFSGATDVWLRPTVDPDGSVDLGNIDSDPQRRGHVRDRRRLGDDRSSFRAASDRSEEPVTVRHPENAVGPVSSQA